MRAVSAPADASNTITSPSAPCRAPAARPPWPTRGTSCGWPARRPARASSLPPQSSGGRRAVSSPSRRASSKVRPARPQLRRAGRRRAADPAAGPVQAEGSERLEADRPQQAAEGGHAAEDQRHGDLHHRLQVAEHADCLVARPTRFHAKVGSFDAAPALAVPGVKEVFAVSQGVAVLADGYWAAKKGRDALKVTWDEAGTEARSSDADRQGVRRPCAASRAPSPAMTATQTGAVRRREGARGDVRISLSGARADGAEQLRHPPHRGRRRRDELRLADSDHRPGRRGGCARISNPSR